MKDSLEVLSWGSCSVLSSCGSGLLRVSSYFIWVAVCGRSVCDLVIACGDWRKKICVRILCVVMEAYQVFVLNILGRLCEYFVLTCVWCSCVSFIFPFGCIQHWWYCVSFSPMCILTLSLYGGVNVHYIRLSIVHCITERFSAPLFTAQVIFR